jgi:hypothetical protein
MTIPSTRARERRTLACLRPPMCAFKPPPDRDIATRLDGEGEQTQLVVAEYAAVRHEIQTALSNQQSALSVGAATLGLLAAVGARFWPTDMVLGGLVFALAVPAACVMAVRMWYGELLRIARAARFIAQLERWVNRRAAGKALTWEHWMSQCRELPGQDLDHATWRSVVMGFGALAAMSVSLGLYLLWHGEGPATAVPVAAIDAALLTRAWQQIRLLRDRADRYLALPDEIEAVAAGDAVIPLRAEGRMPPR